MEQANEIINFSANAIDLNGVSHPFELSIYAPVVVDEHSAYCVIKCSYLREEEFKIFGVDEKQAISEAINFIKNMTNDKITSFLDDDGNPVSIPTPDEIVK